MLTLMESLDLSDAKSTGLLQQVIVGIVEKLRKETADSDITNNNSKSQVGVLFNLLFFFIFSMCFKLILKKRYLY